MPEISLLKVIKDTGTLSFKSTFGSKDDFITGFFQPGGIVELYGSRNGGKLLYVHSIISQFLKDSDKHNTFNIVIFDYAKQFSTNLLSQLIMEQQKITEDEISDMLKKVQVFEPVTYKASMRILRAMSCKVMSSRWELHRKGIAKSTPVIVFMDIGSMLYYSGSDSAGHYRQSEMFRCLDSISRCGSLIVLLNHTKSCDDKCFEPALGKGWRMMVTTRFYFQRDDTGYFYVPIMNNQTPRKYYYKTN